MTTQSLRCYNVTPCTTDVNCAIWGLIRRLTSTPTGRTFLAVPQNCLIFLGEHIWAAVLM